LKFRQAGLPICAAEAWCDVIRVNVLSPGAVATELAREALGEEGLNVYGSMTALQRMGDPAEVGAAAAFLASSDSSFMTASEVAVDGGLAQL
jgi:NAD(P)-dependent dehydrogenase (short-subunit alcohol dehydrogenase family)